MNRLQRESLDVPAMLEIRNLHVEIDDKPILRGVELAIAAGEVHAIMGPNGSGKSTLAQVLAGRETFHVTQGEVRYRGRDLLAMAPEERAREGVFLAFQYPVEIPGVSNVYLLRSAFNAIRKHRHEPEEDAMDFLTRVKDRLAVLEPTLAILDETDSGLDIDALKIVADGVNTMRSPERAIVLVTHYQRLLNYIVPDAVHVLVNGSIAKSGGPALALELERRGYGWMDPAPAAHTLLRETSLETRYE